MQKKSYNAYRDVFSFLKSQGTKFEEIVSDFEIALRKAAAEIFECRLSPCHFHFGQSLWKNMKKICKKHDPILLRKLSCLSLLPQNLIEETYRALRVEYIVEDNKSFFSYFENFWMNLVIIFYF